MSFSCQLFYYYSISLLPCEILLLYRTIQKLNTFCELYAQLVEILPK